MLYAATIFSSAFLLFLVQPIVSKHILPWFGGSAAVWATCLVFFQSVLLLGYAYSDRITRLPRPAMQVGLHGLLLAASLFALPVIAGPAWKPDGSEDPGIYILLLLAATVGLPYLALSATGPLIQSWAARSGEGPRVYRLFSLSNLASLLALLAYPFAIEPWLPLHVQSSAWSIVYAGFGALCLASGISLLRRVGAQAVDSHGEAHGDQAAPGAGLIALWVSLSAMGSWLLLAITNHITQNVAAIPFLWILPLTLYLLTFVLCFESDRWYRRQVWLVPVFVILAVCSYGLQESRLGFDIKVAIPLYCAGLFIACMFLHGEMARLRPAPRYLTRFYLALSFGGAAGGVMVGLVAPKVLPAYYELGIGFVLVALLMAVVLRERRILLACGLLLALTCAINLFSQIRLDAHSARLMERNFYGRLLVRDVAAGKEEVTVRRLLHGAILHGEQYLSGSNRSKPTTYYGLSSGVGRLLAVPGTGGGRHVGVIGLGTGTLAAYGEAGDRFRFYDIDPAVVAIARREFSYLGDSKAEIDIVIGDARLSLDREPPNRFDVLVVDAFSGDSIPVHLMTREALAIYRRHMKDDGVIAFHVSNRFLSLTPVVDALAQDAGLHAVLVSDRKPDAPLTASDWVLVSARQSALLRPAIAAGSSQTQGVPGLRPWTDDASNLFRVLK